MAPETEDEEREGPLARLLDRLPIGGAPVFILVLAVLSGIYLLLDRREAFPADLTAWTFASNHYDAYRAAVPEFERRHAGDPGTEEDDLDVEVQLVHGNAIRQRLRAAFWADVNVPDLCEVEITSAGSFFRGPVDRVGFVDLKPYLERDGLLERLPASRLAPYTNRGRIFGMPHDVHPVMLAYRADLLEPLLAERGMAVADLDTWDAFVAFGREIAIDKERSLIQLEEANSASFEVLLHQRGGGFFAADGALRMDDELAYRTLLWFVELVAEGSPRRIAANLGSWGTAYYQALERGYYLCVICPDWKSKSIEMNLEGLAGKMKLMPLPAFEPGGRRTSTWGGTMIGITRRCPDKDLAWELAKHLYLGTEEAGERFRDTNILAPDRAAWDQPAYHEAREYWSGQKIGELYTALADDVPAQHGHPFLQLAKNKMGEAVSASVREYERLASGDGPFDRAAFGDFVRGKLDEVAAYVRMQMAREPDWEEAGR